MYLIYIALSSGNREGGLISTEQMKAARALLKWDQSDLAMKAGIHTQTVSNMERRGLGRVSVDNASLVQRTFEQAGIRFVSGGAILAGDEGADRDDALRAACLTTWKGA